jgi:hypothetical protein
MYQRPYTPDIVSYDGHTLNLTADHNEDRRTHAYTAGWDSTCQQALQDPNAQHDIYGCPGVSDKTIIHILDVDAARYKASLTPSDKAQIKADCASTWSAKNQTIVVGGKIVGNIVVPKGGVPCL